MQKSTSSILISLQVAQEDFARLQALADANGVEAVADFCSMLLRKSLDEREDMDSTSSEGDRANNLTERVAALELAVSQLRAVNSLDVQSGLGERETDYRDEPGDRPNQSLALPAAKIRTGIFCSRTICNMLGLSYPAGLESLAHRHGGQFVRYGYRFVRLEQKKYGRSKRWRVEAVEPKPPLGRSDRR